MNFTDIQYFLIAAEEMSFTRAAERLHITQQSLSGRIAKLEQQLEVRLFERGNPMILTEAGAFFQERAKVIYSMQEQTLEGLDDIRDFRRGSLKIGILNNQGAHVLPETITKFHKIYPQIKLHFLEAPSLALQEALQKGQINLAIDYSVRADAARVVSVPLFTEQFVVVVPNEILMEYFSEKERNQILQEKEVPLDVFRKCPFLALNKVSWLKDAFEKCCRAYEIEPNIVSETSSVMTRLALCFSGLGIMFSSAAYFNSADSILSDKKMQNVHVFHIDYPETRQEISIQYLKNRYLSRSAKEFIRMLKEKYVITC